jgi:hypothetical protein
MKDGRRSAGLWWEAALALWRAWRAKGTGAALRLPSVGSDASPPEALQALVVSRVDSSLACLAVGHLRTRHICFYRSYAVASILRSLGLPIVLNVGLRPHRSLRRPWGHCWLTLDDQVVFEKGDAAAPYDEPLHDTGAGVRYWLGRPELRPFTRASAASVMLETAGSRWVTQTPA